ncbi:hypothetical protein ACRAKI_22135 [Saccharothrix isguenensis]
MDSNVCATILWWSFLDPSGFRPERVCRRFGGRGWVVDRREYERMVDRFRRLVAPLPAWRVDECDGSPVLVDDALGGGGGVLLRVDSRWNVCLARYFEAVDKDRLLALVALLEVVPPDGPAHRAAVAFLKSLRLGDESGPFGVRPGRRRGRVSRAG